MSKLRVDEIEDTQGNPFDLSPSNVTTLTGTQTVAGALDQRVVYEGAGLTVLIPSDYPTLQEAFDNLANIKVGQGEIIDLVIESGHALTSGVRLDNGYYKNFRISSQDERVEVSGDFSSVSGTDINGQYRNVVFVFKTCHAPIFNIKLEGGDVEGYTPSALCGLVVGDGSDMYCTPGSEVSGFSRNVEIRRSAFVAEDFICSRSYDWGFRCTAGSRISTNGMKLENSCRGGEVGGGSPWAFHVSRGSIANSPGLEIKNSFSGGITVRRSFANISGSVVENAQTYGLDARNGSFVNYATSSVTGSGILDIRASQFGGAYVIVSNGDYGTSSPTPNNHTRHGVIQDNNKPDYFNSIEEVGENQDGTWVKYTDGRAVAYSPVINLTATNSIGAIYATETSESIAKRWTYPVSFVSTPFVVAAEGDEALAYWAIVRTSSKDSTTAGIISPVERTGGRPVLLKAEGFWK